MVGRKSLELFTCVQSLELYMSSTCVQSRELSAYVQALELQYAAIYRDIRAVRPIYSDICRKEQETRMLGDMLQLFCMLLSRPICNI